MPFKNYYTIGGEIFGESTATGGFRGYGRDALGSVAATYDVAGELQNTYRNTPYGTQVQKTGTAADPEFRWNGTSGYRATSRSYSAYYVRARHLDDTTGQWTTVDPLWPSEHPYSYSKANPITSLDPSGMQSGGLGTGQCPGKAASDWLNSWVNSHPSCKAILAHACGGLKQMESGITFFVGGVCNNQPHASGCIVGRHRGKQDCIVLGICFKTRACHDPSASDLGCLLLNELANACSCREHQKMGETLARKIINQCDLNNVCRPATA